jgi:hypothetical protein
VPGGCGIGGCGIVFGGSTQDVRSKNKNSSAFACGVIMLVLQPEGNGLPGSESSPPAPEIVDTDCLMWMSVKTAFPHCIASGVPTGVLKDRYCSDRRICVSIGFLSR